MVFEKGRATDIQIYFNGKQLELVNSFKYLGLTLYKNGRWFRTQKFLSQYGNYALNRLVGIFQNVNLFITEKCKLFDSLVSSVLNYGCEIWGFVHSSELESIHTKFCRQILGI